MRGIDLVGMPSGLFADEGVATHEEISWTVREAARREGATGGLCPLGCSAWAAVEAYVLVSPI